MKKKITLILMTGVVSGLLYFSGIDSSKAHSAGAAAGYTGSPADGRNCTNSGCHNTYVLQGRKPWISSNVPATGYWADSIYTITAKAIKGGGFNSFGFQISPQNTSGTELGTLINTSSTTQIISAKYIEQTSSGYSTTADSMVWTFQWKAPVAGTGLVTFYGCFNCGAGKSKASAWIYPATLGIPENGADGINAISSGVHSFSLFPNPAKEKVNLVYNLHSSSKVEVNIYDIDGRMIYNVSNNMVSEGNHTQNIIFPASVSPGIYLIQLIANGQSTMQRIVLE